jgi:glucan phosphoethanolaminetransferase (alkaline phosphatase superfamily)
MDTLRASLHRPKLGLIGGPVIAVSQRRGSPLLFAVAVAVGVTLNVWLRHKLLESTGQGIHHSYVTVSVWVVVLTGLAAAAFTFTALRPRHPAFLRSVVAGALALVVAVVALFVGFYWPWLFSKS